MHVDRVVEAYCYSEGWEQVSLNAGRLQFKWCVASLQRCLKAAFARFAFSLFFFDYFGIF